MNCKYLTNVWLAKTKFKSKSKKRIENGEMRILVALAAVVYSWESSVFSEKLTLTNSQEGSKFGASQGWAFGQNFFLCPTDGRAEV